MSKCFSIHKGPWLLRSALNSVKKTENSHSYNCKSLELGKKALGCDLAQVGCLLLRCDGSCDGDSTSWTMYWLMPPVFTRSPTHTGTKKSHDIPATKRNFQDYASEELNHAATETQWIANYIKHRVKLQRE